jgi:DNA polymerase III subunit delta
MIYKSYLIEQNVNLIEKNLFLFYGENLGLQQDLKKKIRNNNKDKLLLNFSQEEILKNEDQFFNEVINISLFEDKKVYFINQANDKILKIIEDIETKISEQSIFLFSDILDKRSKLRNYFEKSKNAGIVPCYADNQISIKKIVMDKLKGFNGLSPENINMIIENCNLDRIKLNNELSKIITYFDNKNLETEKLIALLNIDINDDFNLLKDEALNGNKLRTNKLIGVSVLEEQKNFYYINLINQRLHKLAEIIVLAKNNTLEMALDKIKPPIFWKEKANFLYQAKKWNLIKIKKILNKSYDLEIKVKSDPIIKKNVLIKKLIVDICEVANA